MSTLMYKDKPIMEIKDGETNRLPEHAGKVLDGSLLPFQLLNAQTDENLMKWMARHTIPDNRIGLGDVQESFGHILENRTKDKYASLSDPYWIRTLQVDSWKKTQFFGNRKWVSDTGDMFFAPWDIKDARRITTASPTMSTDGRGRKEWICRDNIPALVKEGWIDEETKKGESPLGEVLTSIVCERLGISCVKSEFICYKGTLCSKADCFIKDTEELITLDMILDKGTKLTDESTYNFAKRMISGLHIKDGIRHLDEQIFIDNLTGNADRQLRDIGFIRNVETGQIRPAPIFDSGTAYWHSHAVQDAKKQKYFFDVEKDISERMKKEFDMRVLTGKKENDELFKMLSRYPDITKKKIDGLRTAIQNRNRFLVERK